MMYKARSLEIVSHCFCPPGLAQYAEHLKWQWASLVNNPPPVPTTLSVCFTAEDEATMDRLVVMRDMVRAGMCPQTLSLQIVALPPSQLFRRAIGRNWCAKRTKADAVWMTDVDYLFGPGCLAELAKLVGPQSRLVMPARLWLNTTHAIGDKMIEDNKEELLPQIDMSLFSERRQRICIGGCQIVGGDLARTIGYLDGTDWVQPVDAASGFHSCRCDKVFRRLNKLSAERLPIPNVLRIRHSSDGRDFDEHGQKVGKEAWR